MSNETRYLLVTLPDVSGEQADEVAQDMEDCITGRPVGAYLPPTPDATVTHAPQLWMVLVDGPDWIDLELYATQEQCSQHLVDRYTGECGAVPGATSETVMSALAERGILVMVQRWDYPVHPAAVKS